MTSAKARRLAERVVRPGVEYEFDRLTIDGSLSRSLVTRMLIDRAEHGGWELDRVRITPDGTRRVVLRRKIIRQRPLFVLVDY